MWSVFVLVAGMFDKSNGRGDPWILSAILAYALIVLLEIIFFLQYRYFSFRRNYQLWLCALTVASTLTIGVALVVFWLSLWHDLISAIFDVVLFSYALFIIGFIFKGLKTALNPNR